MSNACNPISIDALEKRIQRALKPDDQALHRCAPQNKCHRELGDHYTTIVSMNVVDQRHVDIEALGRELGVLASNETVTAY